MEGPSAAELCDRSHDFWFYLGNNIVYTWICHSIDGKSKVVSELPGHSRRYDLKIEEEQEHFSFLQPNLFWRAQSQNVFASEIHAVILLVMLLAGVRRVEGLFTKCARKWRRKVQVLSHNVILHVDPKWTRMAARLANEVTFLSLSKH